MTTLKQVRQAFRRGWTAAPLVREVPADLFTPVSAYLRLARRGEPSFLLESVEGGERVARYSFLGAGPLETLSVRGGRAYCRDSDGRETALDGAPLAAIHARLSSRRAEPLPGLPRFLGGAVGFVGYELAGRLEPALRLKGTEGDEARLMVFGRAAAFDHVRHRVLLAAHVFAGAPGGVARSYRAACDALDEMEADLRRPLRDKRSGDGARGGLPARRPMLKPRQALGEAAFLEGVRRLKRHILAGDIFQGVLSERFEVPLQAEPFAVYRALRGLNPSPYMFYIDMGGETALGASPEMLVRVEDREVETRPIAGTRRRGADEEEDKRLEASLLASVKERAEHLMLVDLGRNDVGRVAQPGSVRVASFMQVERYSHVMHIVSSVTGRLRRGLTPWDAFAACFPAGTVTGAPKIRAMQLLSEIEPRPRGLYAGAVVYCDFRGNLDSAIAIRSLLARKGTAYVQAGAGVVADSTPRRELEEVRAKSRAMLAALEAA